MREECRRPTYGTMALQAFGAKSDFSMIWIDGRIIILFSVTTDAGNGNSRVLSAARAWMTRGAIGEGVAAGEREPRLIMLCANIGRSP